MWRAGGGGADPSIGPRALETLGTPLAYRSIGGGGVEIRGKRHVIIKKGIILVGPKKKTVWMEIHAVSHYCRLPLWRPAKSPLVIWLVSITDLVPRILLGLLHTWNFCWAIPIYFEILNEPKSMHRQLWSQLGDSPTPDLPLLPMVTPCDPCVVCLMTSCLTDLRNLFFRRRWCLRRWSSRPRPPSSSPRPGWWASPSARTPLGSQCYSDSDMSNISTISGYTLPSCPY